jgi:protein gp37
MAQNSKIQWTEATWNPVAGCSIASPGCHNCYAAKMAARLEKMGQAKYAGTTKDGRWTGKIAIDEESLRIPLKRKKPTTYFVNSMSDLFHENVPFEFVDKVFAVMAYAQRHKFQVLTKRADRMQKYFKGNAAYGRVRTLMDDSSDIRRMRFDSLSRFERAEAQNQWWTDLKSDRWPLQNVWLGVSVEDQKRADERIPLLLQTPAAIRFVSYEPALGPVDFRNYLKHQAMPDRIVRPGSVPVEYIPVVGLDWIIVGGESGPNARPCNVDWIRSTIRQCRDAGVACFVKQLGAVTALSTGGLFLDLEDSKGGDWNEWPRDLCVRKFPQPAAICG